MVQHAEIRRLTLRLDDDAKELREDLREVKATRREHTTILNERGATLQEHTARFDSVDGQLRSLTQLVGKVLDRLPETPGGA
ncbi:hypothetical protein AOZ06_50155 [Kibdelosporangium phytohabitans]|uniref:Uncharacterized protein n=1 Tax=Kibdelosporangium phytohabitans TaxID=860235 RepID=A0A0N9I1Y1_9PSEU|nr:hypothetical protein AOZ06_50155 [Kibdelosporangium phytohabitans]